MFSKNAAALVRPLKVDMKLHNPVINYAGFSSRTNRIGKKPELKQIFR